MLRLIHAAVEADHIATPGAFYCLSFLIAVETREKLFWPLENLRQPSVCDDKPVSASTASANRRLFLASAGQRDSTNDALGNRGYPSRWK
jgi:hypothetical protein